MSQAYAPISSYSTQPKSSFFTEISLSKTHKEQSIYESLAELYSIITTLEIIEKSYLKDNVSNEDYTQIVSKLISQYSTILKQQDVKEKFGTLDQFILKYSLNANNAKNRLEIGVPITIEHSAPRIISGNGGSSSGGNNKLIAETTGNLITLMDALKLNYKAKDQLYPLLGDLIQNLNKLGKKDEELIKWLIKLNKMSVLEELDDDDIRKFLFDLDNAYKEFYTSLE